jgi:hypothetical protein
MKIIVLTTLLMVVCGAVAGQNTKCRKSGLPNIYSNSSLGFRYTPPRGMRDETEFLKTQIRKEEGNAGTAGVHNALLAMFSLEDGSDPNWRSLTVETYPRSAISDPNDASAEAKMSAWLAHSEDASATSNKSAVVSGQRFSVSVFAVQDGSVRKGAVVWTTVRQGRLLSFFFAANSPDQLKALAETMKTVEFF